MLISQIRSSVTFRGYVRLHYQLFSIINHHPSFSDKRPNCVQTAMFNNYYHRITMAKILELSERISI
jgi:hypothetical protein